MAQCFSTASPLSRDALLGVLLDSGTTPAELQDVVEMLKRNPHRGNALELTREAQHIILYLQHDDLTPVHVWFVLDVLLDIARRQPLGVTTDVSVTTWRKIVQFAGFHLQLRLCCLFSAANADTTANVNARFLDLMLEVVDNGMNCGPVWSPLATCCLDILKRRFENGLGVYPFRDRLGRVVLRLLQSRPLETEVHQFAFVVLSDVGHGLTTQLVALYSVLTSVVDHLSATGPGSRARAAVAALSRSSLCCIAAIRREKLVDAAPYILPLMRQLPLFYEMEPQSAVISRETISRIRATLTTYLLQCRTHAPQFLQSISSELWIETQNANWLMRGALRVVMVEEGHNGLPKAFSLNLCTRLQIIRVLKFHGVSLETAERCSITGEEFVTISQPYLDFVFRPDAKELQIMLDMQTVFRCMQAITERQWPERITPEDMTRVLRPLHHRRALIHQIAAHRDADRHFYFDTLLPAAPLLAEICQTSPEL